ncbi:MAG: thioredoxin family protein [Gammaproteobacteria bacterium]|nr:thioredoxin family protein [Gammaproteobacteria bacterium]
MWLVRISKLLLLGAFLAGTAVASQTRDPQEHFFQETFGDFQEELEIAREEGKSGILLFFEMDECPFCHRMKTSVVNQVEVQDYFREHFRIFSVDIEGDVEVVDFDGTSMKAKDFSLKKHRVRATPVLAFFDLEGNKVFKYTGATANPEEFMWMGEFIVTKAYNETKFSRYKREKRKEAQKK